ncbi:hypothetical protein [Okeania sp. SIO3I5]|nr:hypothetical protein [Okeania sp. SIO3I5]
MWPLYILLIIIIELGVGSVGSVGRVEALTRIMPRIYGLRCTD